MPVSPLSDVMLCRRVWLLLPLGEATEECHNEPESHPGEGKSVPRKRECEEVTNHIPLYKVHVQHT